MPLSGRLFPGDEELGKKFDDPRSNDGGSRTSSSLPWRVPIRFRKRRIVFAIIVFFALYGFSKYLPADFTPRTGVGTPLGGQSAAGLATAPTGKPPRDSAQQDEAGKHYFSGPIKFYKLAASLHAAVNTMGLRLSNRNVVFAASSLKSASVMIPMACEMARWRRNNVHFVVLGRDDLSIQGIKEVNGIMPDCDVYWHDGRPDYSPWSSEFRMEVSVTAAFEHIHNFVHPQVIIADYSPTEDAFFTRGLRNKAQELKIPVIELPSNAAEMLMWMTRLDSGSLRAWHKATVDLLIHAPAKSSGTLIRLLKSIEKADYFGSARPRLTIELPSEIDPPTKRFLENLVWPPADGSHPPHTNQVILRHRIPRQTMTSEEASIRFVESFYPKLTTDSHVLLLSPQTELSPLYYHYLKYHLLEYRYSSYGFQSPQNLLGISLELPSSYLNGSSPFIPPLSKPSPFSRSNNKPDQHTSFLWQAPHSHAALYFGDKWVEFHSFLSKRLEAQHSHTQPKQPTPKRTKLISETYPSWMEYLLELMRARGYLMLYPHFDSDDAIVTVHNEFYQPPEEFVSHPSSSSSTENTTTTPSELPTNGNDAFAADTSTFLPSAPATNPEPPLLTTSLLALLPAEGDLPELASIPLLSHAGDTITSADATTRATFFTGRFRSEIGGCGGGVTKARRPLSASDLFCLEADEDEDGDEGEVEVVMARGAGLGEGADSGSLTKTPLLAPTTTTMGTGSGSVLGEAAIGTAPVVVQPVASAEL